MMMTKMNKKQERRRLRVWESIAAVMSISKGLKRR
jgi:hypothetical protein